VLLSLKTEAPSFTVYKTSDYIKNLDLSGRKWKEPGENGLMRSFIT
jgi:hypothetical protein